MNPYKGEDWVSAKEHDSLIENRDKRIAELEQKVDTQKQMLNGDDEQVVELENKIVELKAERIDLVKALQLHGI